MFDLRHLGDLRSSAAAAAAAAAAADAGATGATGATGAAGAAAGRPAAEACVRLTGSTFRRAGGSFRRYYALEDVAQLADRAALTLTEGRYCCVRLENRKRGTTMDRVYVHAVFTKPL